jgi:septal ring factor EnvC (AmiA/AmiB activator)
MATTTKTTIDKIITGLMLAGIAALIGLVLRMSVTQAVIVERQARQETQLEKLTTTIYDQGDALRDRTAVERAFAEMGARLTTVEGQFRAHVHDQQSVEQRLARLEERVRSLEKHDGD